MNRIKIINITGGTIILVGTTSYLLSDKSNLLRADIKPKDDKNKTIKPDEKETGWCGILMAKINVMKKDFRERGIDQIKKEVSELAGWIFMTSKGDQYCWKLVEEYNGFS